MSEDLFALAQYQKDIAEFHRYLHAAKRFPQGDQVKIIRDFFNNGRTTILVQSGRDAGKTEIELYCVWRFAITNPGSEIYIICPERRQAQRIFWRNKRIIKYGPRRFLEDPVASEMILPFKNGSFIATDACENYDALRGIKPKLVVYEEDQHHSKSFDEEVMQPNFSRGTCSLLSFGTPPKRYCDYVEFRKGIIEKVKAGHPKFSYYELPTWTNPLSDKNWLAEKKADLIKKGKVNVWLREYEGKLVFDSESAILPFFDKARHACTEKFIRDRVGRDAAHLKWYAIFDPGTVTCFAVLFLCVNPYTGEVFILDEIYETKRGETSAVKIWNRAEEIKKKWFDNVLAWENIYDCAAAWFQNEILNHYNDHGETFEGILYPCNKQHAPVQGEGRAGESILNVLMESSNQQLFWYNVECRNFVMECESYVTDEHGKYPVTFDHLIDCLFYWVLDSHYTVVGMGHIPKDEDIDDGFKDPPPRTMDAVLMQEIRKRDWGYDLEVSGYYDSEEY